MTHISFGYQNPLQERFGETFFKEIPQGAGVYYFSDAKEKILYVGKAKNLKRRLMNYQAAKPGQVGEHILEMIEHANTLKWEELKTEEIALRREEELIRSLRPRYNIAMNWDVPYLYLGFKTLTKRGAKAALQSSSTEIEFQLSNVELDTSFNVYGCFRHRGKIKSGYTALLRLMFAAFCERERFNLPAKICRSSPAWVYRTTIPTALLAPLKRFLEGRDDELLKLLLNRLLEREGLPKQLYIPLQRDFSMAKDFFKYGPRDTRSMAKRTGLKTALIHKKQMDRVVHFEFKLKTLET